MTQTLLSGSLLARMWDVERVVCRILLLLISNSRPNVAPHVRALNREVNNLEVGVATSRLPIAVIVVGMASSLNLSRPQYELPGRIKRPRTATTGLVGLWLAEHGQVPRQGSPSKLWSFFSIGADISRCSCHQRSLSKISQ